jgi:endonuclease YncB( thermonuclease family)
MNRPVDLRYEPHGRYGSVVASCFKGAEDLNRWTVANE